MRWLYLPVLVLGGCPPEYEFWDDLDQYGDYERPDLTPPVQVDVVSQVVSPEVDILWVIDNSGSMADEQAKLAENFPLFMDYFLESGLDYHIGVTTTDTTSTGLGGALRPVGAHRYITPNTPRPTEIFSQMARVGVGGSFDETGSCSAWRSLTQPTANIQSTNQGFFRDEAALHIIFVTDESDSSYTFEESPCSGSSAAEFIQYLNTLKADPEIPVTVSAIAGPPPRGCLQEPGDPLSAVGVGRPYDEMVENVGPHSPDGSERGAFYSICEDDWAPILDDLGLATSALRRVVYLTGVPDLVSLAVYVDTPDEVSWEGIAVGELPEDHDKAALDAECEARGAAACFAYEYDPQRNAIWLLDFTPPPESVIRVEYVRREDAGDTDGFAFGG